MVLFNRLLLLKRYTSKSRRFGFVTFDDYDPIAKIICVLLLKSKSVYNYPLFIVLVKKRPNHILELNRQKYQNIQNFKFSLFL